MKWWTRRTASTLAVLLAVAQLLGSCSPDEPLAPPALLHVETGILAQISGAELRRFAEDLTSIGPRYSGTPEEAEARDYLVGKFQEMGLEVSLHSFEYLLWQPVRLEMELEGPEGGAVPGVALGFSPSTPAEGVVAEIVYVGKGLAEDYAKLPWSRTAGKIHLADSSPDGERSILCLNAQIHGAAGFVYIRTWKGEAGESLVEVGSVFPVVTIPAVSVDQDTGDRLRRLAGRRLLIRAENRSEWSTSMNVRGVLRGRSEEFITVGAHFDSWYVGESAADNATGVAGLLESARVLSQRYDLDRSVHFVAFSVEELDLQGSINYVLQNLPDITANCGLMVNLDVCGLAGGVAGISASPREVGERALAQAETMGFAARTGSPIVIADELELGSDHLPYLVLGVPMLYVSKTPNIYYHTRYDTLDRIDFQSLRCEVALAARIVADEAGAVLRSR